MVTCKWSDHLAKASERKTIVAGAKWHMAMETYLLQALFPLYYEEIL